MNILSLFDGLSGGHIALDRAFINVDNYYASEVDKYAIEITQKNYPNTVQLGDVSKVSYKKGILETENGNFNVGKIDMIIGGSPCFVAGTRVYTKNGYKAIEKLKVGDEVLTHKNRFKKIIRIGNTPNQSIWEIVSADGEKFLTTANHPFMVSRKKSNKFSEPKFKRVDEINLSDYLVGPKEIGNSEKGYLYTEISSIRKGIDTKTVYNIEVEEDHTYMVLTKFVHNCQSFTFAGKREGMATEDKIEITTLEDYLDYKKKGFKFSGQSYLFWEYIRILKEVKPTYFFLENVKMETKWKDIITKAVGVEPININSNLLSAQNRDRLYWTNINNGVIPIPNKSDLVLKDILIPEMEDKYPLSLTHYNAFMKSYPNWKYCPIDKKSKPLLATYYKQPPHCPYIPSSKSESGYRRLSPIECERLQTLPDDYTKGVSDTQRYKMIGNGWTIDVIAYIFSFIENYEYYKNLFDKYEVSLKNSNLDIFYNYIDLKLSQQKTSMNNYNEKINYKILIENCKEDLLKKGEYEDNIDLKNLLSSL